VKIRNAIYSLILISILISIGFGTSIIYSDYIFNPTGFLTSVNIVDSSYLTSEPGSENNTYNESKNRMIIEKIDEWANSSKATIIHKNGFVAGAGFYCYSDWINNNLNIDVCYGNNKRGVYLLNDASIYEAYVEDNIFFSDTLALEILGTYSNNNIPAVIKDVDFIFPLSLSNSIEGMYFTDAIEIHELINLFENNGYEVLSIRQPRNMTIDSLIHTLMFDTFLSRALLIALIGLCFCFIYCILWMYKVSFPLIWIHHLFGLSNKRLVLIIFIKSFGIGLISIISFRSALVNGLTYLDTNDIINILRYVIMLVVSLLVIANLMGLIQLRLQTRLRGT